MDFFSFLRSPLGYKFVLFDDMDDEEETGSRIDDIKYYTSMFLGTVAINALFSFLFLGVVPHLLPPSPWCEALQERVEQVSAAPAVPPD